MVSGGADMIVHNTTINGKRTPEYNSWRCLVARCNNPNHAGYKDYGGRGITVDEDWDDFTSFLNDMGYKPTQKHQIDRIDNNGNYTKTNCRWSTAKDNNNNRRNNK